ncbi:MAG: hypothetical protein GQ574_02835 [Crocinitomix sp.]|nr:hypothetical protein [Crocinitomix sp.]
MTQTFRIIILTFFLGKISLGHTQDSLSYSYQPVSVGIHSSIFDIRPHVTFNFKRHQLGAGMVIRKPQQYYWYVSPSGSSYSLGPSQKGISLNGANLFYRFYPLKPKESFTFCFENYLGLKHNRLDFNGAFYQRNFRLTEAIHIHGRYKFLERYAVFIGFGPAMSLHFAKDTEGLPFFLPAAEKYPRLDFHFNLILGIEFGIN